MLKDGKRTPPAAFFNGVVVDKLAKADKKINHVDRTSHMAILQQVILFSTNNSVVVLKFS